MSFPIAELSPYHTKWSIQARVTSEVKIREFSAGRSGKVFSADLLDRHGDQIRASFFNEAATKFANILEQGKVFTFSKGQLKVANKQFNNLPHPYEITFHADAIIAPCADDFSIQAMKYSFTDLRILSHRALPFVCDVLGIVTAFNAPRKFTSKDGSRNFTKAGVTICDATGHSMDIGIWGDAADKLQESDFAKFPVIAFKGVRIQEYQGRTGSLSESGFFNVYDGAEGEALKKWWEMEGNTLHSTGGMAKLTDATMAGGAGRDTKPLTLAETREKTENLGSDPEYWDTIARLSYVTTKNRDGEAYPVMYNACQEQRDLNGRVVACNKKMDRNQCPIHGVTENHAWRWMPRAQFHDETDTLYLSAFESEFSMIVGKTANEAQEIMESGVKIESLLRKSYNARLFKIRVMARLEEYQGEQRPKTRIAGCKPISFSERGRYCLDQIRQLTAM